MPREVELHLSRTHNLQDCYQTAKELLTIVQTTVTNKMSALSLAQSRFIAHFEDLASLNNIQDDYKLHAFKIYNDPEQVETVRKSKTAEVTI